MSPPSAKNSGFEVAAAEGERRAKDDDAEALVYRGRASMRAAFARSSAEAFKQAAAYYKQALERDPDNTSAQVGLGAFHIAMSIQHLDIDSSGHLKTASETLQEVLRRPAVA
jgi:tetratricopeptide (TPR) repeat protein